MKIEKGKIIKKIFLSCIYVIILLCFLYNVIFSINVTIFKKEYLQISGISLFNMKSELMQDDIKKGDLVIVKETDEAELQKGDIIAYTINGKTRVNKIVNLAQGKYTTKSNKNYNPDIEKIEYNQIIGKMVLHISGYGFIMEILQSKITTGLLLLALVLRFLYNKYLFEKKQERTRKKLKNGQM